MTDEQRALQDAVREAAVRAGAVQAARESGAQADKACWAALADVGVFGVALPVEVGGAGGTVADAAAALEQCAAEMVPGPVLSTVLAGLLLARAGDSPSAKELLPGIAEGSVSVAVALAEGSLDARQDAGGWRVSGELGVLPAATDKLLLGAHCGDVEVWFVLDGSEVELTALDPVDGSRPLVTGTLTDLAVSSERVVAGPRSEDVRDLAVTLAAAEASGVAGWALRTATDYARIRQQFGRPIGSFQSIKHLCVTMLCRAEQAGAVAWDAARAADDATDELPLTAAVAASIALDAGVDVAKDAIQVLGGIGFTWEHDAHLYLRRALTLRQLLGPTSRWRTRVAELTLDGARRSLAVTLDDATEAQRDEVRAQVQRVAELPVDQRRIRLADTGLLVPHWPAPYGQDASAALQLLIDEELRGAGVERPDLVIGAWAVPTIIEHGTPEQSERFVAPTLRGEIDWCQLFSEPEAGSDLASLRTRAVRVDGGWSLTGSKVWTSRAKEADWAICLARTDPDARKNKGITYFLVDMRTEGIDIRPLREITGDAMFNEVFLDGVFVPDDCVVGEINGGWPLARTTLANERVAMGGGSSLGDAVERLVEAWPGPDERLGSLIAEGLVVSLLDLRATLRRLDGRSPGAESSVRKLIGVRHRQDVAEAALDVAGPRGAVHGEDTDPLVHEFLLTRCLSIAGGTTQILLSLSGERILGLPREPS